MAKTKYTATYQGHVWTRASDRIYTHMVVGVVSIAARRARHSWHVNYSWHVNLEYLRYVASGKEGHFENGNGRPFTLAAITDPAEIARAQAELDAGIEAYMVKRMAAWEASLANDWKSEDGLHTVYSAGWCGRLALAQKLASRTPGGVIVEAMHK